MKNKKINIKKKQKDLFQYLDRIYKFKYYTADTNIHIKKPSLFPLNKKNKKINIKFPLSDRRIVFNYLRKNKANKKISIISNKIKNKQNASLKNKITYLKNKIDFSRIYKKIGKHLQKTAVSAKPIKSKKTKFILPWIVQGREQQLKLEHTLMFLLFRLKRSRIKKNNKIAILAPQDSKLIKQYRKKTKFSKFGRYGTHAKFKIKSNKFKAKFVKPIGKKIKRQAIYLQSKRFSIINNSNHILSYQYIYMLIIIWYILNNIFLIHEKKMFNSETWLNYFLKNLWIHQSSSTTINWYLNYGTIMSFRAVPQAITLYNLDVNMANYQLKPLRIYDRLFLGISNKKKPVNIKQNFKLKRKSKIRHFFKISPKLKNNKKVIKFFFNKKTKKKVKMQKRLSAEEWLLMSKFTRKKYQDKFSTVFSQWKNVKQIQRYINKQTQVWHQPYFITHPYYYTNRYNTFIYQMAQE